MSASSSYRRKLAMAKELAPQRDAIRDDILRESYLQCDELWWAMGAKPGYGLVALSRNACLIKISESRSNDTIKAFLPDYKGIVGQDSWHAWMHVGTDHQMCLPHQIRLPKSDLKYNNPKNDASTFLIELEGLIKQYMRANHIKDMHTRRVVANCLDSQLMELLNRDWADDKTINKYRKRFRREGYFMSTFLRKKCIEPSNNNIERMNRKFAAARNDGGGNRSSRGSEANSVLFTIYATCKVRDASFYDVMLNSPGAIPQKQEPKTSHTS